MNKNLNKLISISSDTFLDQEKMRVCLNSLSKEYKQIPFLKDLYVKNGFVAFESALRVFPLFSQENDIDIITWNQFNFWKKFYSLELKKKLFFATDVFGDQFYIDEKNYFHKFNMETGESEFLAENIEEWARKILDNYNYLLGHSLCFEWQKINGNLKINDYLVPKIPFVLGGEYGIDNMYKLPIYELIELKINIFKQIKNLTDGTKITLNT